MVKSWLKVFLFQSKKNKTYFLLNVLCLAIGIAAVFLSTIYWQEEHAFEQWNTNRDEIYLLESQGKTGETSAQPYILSSLLKEHYSFVEDYVLYSGYFPAEVVYKKKKYTVEHVLQTNASFFNFFPYPLVYGTASSLFQNPKEIALEKEKARLIFGVGVNPVGEQVFLDDVWYTVVGVYDLEDKRSSFAPDAVVNDHQFIPEDLVDNWNHSSASLLVRTKQKEALTQAADSVYKHYNLKALALAQNVSLEEFLKSNGGLYELNYIAHPLATLHFSNADVLNIPTPTTKLQFLYVIVGLSWVMLLLALFNYVNLSLSQSLSRGKEVGVRKVLGGTKGKIMMQSLLETAIVVLLSAVLGFFFVLWILPFANSFLATHINVNMSDVLYLFVGIVVLISVVGGVPSSLYLANYNVLKVIKGDYHRSRAGSVLKNSFLIIQFAIAGWFMTGTYIVYQQVNYMVAKDLGFKGDQVMSFPFLEELYGKDKESTYQTFKQEALKIKGVEQVAFSDLDYGDRGRSGFAMVFPYEGVPMQIAVSNVEDGYLEMMQIGLKEGRYLTHTLANDSIENAVINETLFRHLQKENIDGLQLARRNIVGVVRDFHAAGLEHPIGFMMFILPSEQYFNFNKVSVKVDIQQLETVLPALEKLWLTFHVETSKPFEYQFVDQKFAQSFEQVQVQKRVMLYLSYLVLFIALFGLFAVSSYTIGTKLRTIAIRKVLGANSKDLTLHLSYQYVLYAILGFGLSLLPNYYLLNRWLNNYAYRIEIGYEVYLVCLLLIMVLTLLIVVSRAYAATKINVLQYIKYE